MADEKNVVQTIRVLVKGPATGRWRAGLYFGSEAVEVNVTPEQLAALKADTALAVQSAESKAKPAGK